MLGILYLILSSFAGYHFLKSFIPRLFKVSKESSLMGKKIKLSNWMVTLPAAFLSGTLFVTCTTYILTWIIARLFPSIVRPLIYGDIITFLILIVLTVIIVIKRRDDFKLFFQKFKKIDVPAFNDFVFSHKTELIYVVVCLVLWSALMIRSFNVDSKNDMNLGLSVFSDFGAHIPMIRSFSEGSNFPTEYPHFGSSTADSITGNNVKYHFMFQFLSGNLEFLGLRIDWAFNIPSILAMLAFLMLLYSFAVLLFGNRLTGVIAAILFFFRSSFAIFTYAAGLSLENTIPVSAGDGILKYPYMFLSFLGLVSNNDKNIGKTAHEDWGFYAQKVYVNKRHYVFALGIAFLVLVILFPLFKKMIFKLKKSRSLALEEFQKQSILSVETVKFDNSSEEVEEQAEIQTEVLREDKTEALAEVDAEAKTEEKRETHTEKHTEKQTQKQPKIEPAKKMPISSLEREFWLKEFLFSKDAWLPDGMKRSIAVGLLLGLAGYWNGAVVIAILPVLFFMAVFSKNRLEYLNIAAITIVLVLGQVFFFSGGGSSSDSVSLSIGYLAQFPNGINGAANTFLTEHNFTEFFKLVPDLSYNILLFYLQLLGFLPLLLVASIPFSKRGGRWLTIAFLSPLIIATMFKFSKEVDANHVIIIFSVILLNIIIANLITRLLSSKSIIAPLIIMGLTEIVFYISAGLFKFTNLFVPVNIGALIIVVLIFIVSIVIRKFNFARVFSISVAVLLLIALTSSGIADGFVLYNMDKSAGVTYSMDNKMIKWVEKNTSPKALFLINPTFIQEVLVAGRTVFAGGAYFASTAGYDFDGRTPIVKRMYGAQDAESLKKDLKAYKIDYIVVDNGNRESKEYTLNEALIKSTFECVYKDDATNTQIYKVK